MKSFIGYLKDYLHQTSRKSLLFTLLFVAVLIVVNYTFGIERHIREIHPWPLSLLSFFFFYGFVLFFAWGIQYSCGDRPISLRIAGYRRFFLFLLLAPLYFSFKMIHWDFSPFIPSGWPAPWSRYTQIVLQLPAKLLLLWLLLWACYKLEGDGRGGDLATGRCMTGLGGPGLPDAGALSGLGVSGRWGALSGGGTASFFGLTSRNFRARPYFMILLLLVPLIALASTRPDFLHTYPKVKNIGFLSGYTHPVWPWKALYELSYGLDFLSIELFFRGFLVIGLARYAGQYAILPMAAFYCTIHFGKPLGECISSLFGGLALGVIAWRTRSILGGLIVHLGLAWMMELGGWIGNMFL